MLNFVSRLSNFGGFKISQITPNPANINTPAKEIIFNINKKTLMNSLILRHTPFVSPL